MASGPPATATGTCDGPYQGKRLSNDELRTVLERHVAWLKAYMPNWGSEEAQRDVRKAKLCGADLSGVDLSVKSTAERAASRIILHVLGKQGPLESPPVREADWSVDPDLSHADLRNAFLAGADLSGASVAGADLRGADLRKAKLLKANLAGADLRDADLTSASLSKADLSGTQLAGARLDANLSDATLADTDLKDARIRGANLSGADLRGLDLRTPELAHTHLVAADLTKAQLPPALPERLEFANLTSVSLKDVDLRGRNLRGAKLIGADLSGANLAGAKLDRADLSKALLERADLTRATVSFADFHDAWYEPNPGAGPDLLTMAAADNLQTMYYLYSPQAMLELRSRFQAAGMWQQERELTYAIRRTKRRLAGGIEGAFNYVLFEVTCGYGLWPGRPLQIIALLTLVFAVPYMGSLRRPGEDGIWREWNEGRIREDLGKSGPTRLQATGFRMVWLGLYFSLLSAFRIGWRDLNVGNWIARIQPREYTLRSTGWVRTVSGVQSLISVYLLALWALTYFGRPFE